MKAMISDEVNSFTALATSFIFLPIYDDGGQDDYLCNDDRNSDDGANEYQPVA